MRDMSSIPSPPDTTPMEEKKEFGFRTAKGEWRPPYPVKYAPIFCWPPKPFELFKWLASYPGFLWPWNSVYLAITLVVWFWFQPPLEQCKTFHWSWMTYMLVRNLVLMWIVYGFWHALLYIFKIQGDDRRYDPRPLEKNSKRFLFKNQVLDNIFWTSGSGLLVWTAYEVMFIWAYANGYAPMVTWEKHPVYFAVWLCIIPFWREFHFYWIHRMSHLKVLYKTVHYLHHKNVNVGPWSGMAMHPVEHILYFSVVLIHWIVPSHPIHMLFNAQHTALTPASAHNGYEGPLLEGKLPGGSYFHYLHHRYFECNYGESALPLDRMFGTFRDGMSNQVVAGKIHSTESAEAIRARTEAGEV
jgi:sterol desaturase/sphingolipid hydroxylase (fatty acid hydroxylase superfamily)